MKAFRLRHGGGARASLLSEGASDATHAAVPASGGPALADTRMGASAGTAAAAPAAAAPAAAAGADLPGGVGSGSDGPATEEAALCSGGRQPSSSGRQRCAHSNRRPPMPAGDDGTEEAELSSGSHTEEELPETSDSDPEYLPEQVRWWGFAVLMRGVQHVVSLAHGESACVLPLAPAHDPSWPCLGPSVLHEASVSLSISCAACRRAPVDANPSAQTVWSGEGELGGAGSWRGVRPPHAPCWQYRAPKQRGAGRAPSKLRWNSSSGAACGGRQGHGARAEAHEHGRPARPHHPCRHRVLPGPLPHHAGSRAGRGFCCFVEAGACRGR